MSDENDVTGCFQPQVKRSLMILVMGCFRCLFEVVHVQNENNQALEVLQSLSKQKY